VCGYDLALEDDGSLILLVEIEGGQKLPLSFQWDELAALSAALSLLTTRPSTRLN